MNAGVGYAAQSGFDAHDAAQAGRRADGPAQVRSQTEGRKTRGDGGGLTAAGASRSPVQVPGIARLPENLVVGFPPQGELRHVGLPQQNPAGRLQPGIHLRVLTGYIAVVNLRSHGHSQPCSFDAVLECVGHTVEGAQAVAPHYRFLGFPGLLQRVAGEEDDGVQRGVELLDTFQVGLDHLHWGQHFLAYLCRQFCSRSVVDLFTHGFPPQGRWWSLPSIAPGLAAPAPALPRHRREIIPGTSLGTLPVSGDDGHGRGRGTGDPGRSIETTSKVPHHHSVPACKLRASSTTLTSSGLPGKGTGDGAVRGVIHPPAPGKARKRVHQAGLAMAAGDLDPERGSPGELLLAGS